MWLQPTTRATTNIYSKLPAISRRISLHGSTAHAPQNMIQPPPYDPNWQLRQTQFYNSPSVTGQYGQNQYFQGQQQQVPYNRDRQNPRTSKQAQHICELCGNRGHYDYQCQFATDFMQRMQKAFQHSHYMHDNNQDQEWSQGDDHNDQEQPFQ